MKDHKSTGNKHDLLLVLMLTRRPRSRTSIQEALVLTVASKIGSQTCRQEGRQAKKEQVKKQQQQMKKEKEKKRIEHCDDQPNQMNFR